METTVHAQKTKDCRPRFGQVSAVAVSPALPPMPMVARFNDALPHGQLALDGRGSAIGEFVPLWPEKPAILRISALDKSAPCSRGPDLATKPIRPKSPVCPGAIRCRGG